FEKESVGLRDAYGAELLYHVDLDREKKRARDTVFAAQAAPEVISSSKVWSAPSQLETAEQKLAMGELDAARQIAEQVVQHNNGGDEPGHATFILARIATLSGKIEEARTGFQQTVQSVHDPRMLAWSHIYLGRIFDLQEQREAAVAEYRAALQAGDPPPDTKTAAQRGLAGAYQPPSPRLTEKTPEVTVIYFYPNAYAGRGQRRAKTAFVRLRPADGEGSASGQDPGRVQGLQRRLCDHRRESDGSCRQRVRGQIS